MNQQSIITAFGRLTRSEQAEVLDRLKEEHAQAEGGSLTADEAAILDERMARYRLNPESAFDAEEVCDEMVRFAREG